MAKPDRTARRSQPRTTAPRALPGAALSQVTGAGVYHDMLVPQDSADCGCTTRSIHDR